jgi:hypothetical protein
MKVVCIKECSYSFSHLDYYFNIGDQFELSKIQPIYFPKTSNDHKEDVFSSVKINIVIDFIDGKSYDVTVLKNDFNTLEQWRDNKLNSILDEMG